jgi:glutathione reductase (NADPH)
VKEKDGTLTLHLKNGEVFPVGSSLSHLVSRQVHRGYDVILKATGRHANVSNLGLSSSGVSTAPNGTITVDEYQNTNVPGIYALGDVCGKVELTPMAIAAGRRLSDRFPSPSSLASPFS